MLFALRQDKWLIVGGFFVALASFFCVYHIYKSWTSFNIIHLSVPDCDLQKGPCVSRLPTGEEIELDIKPTHMPVLTSVKLTVKTRNIPVKKIDINFKGAEMNMGEFRYELRLQKDGLYTTQTILPTCIHDQMIWHAVLNIQATNKRYSAPFVFINNRPTNI